MEDLTVSEKLFERFCNENSIRYHRIEQEQHRTPDYDVYFDEHLVIAEVKQIDPNKNDKALHNEGRSRGIVVAWERTDSRIRNKIGSAKRQLKTRSKGRFPTILVLYDNVPTGSIDADDIKTAMYGHETVRYTLSNNAEDMSAKIDYIGFGSERKFTSSDNTTFSAIALLHKFGDGSLLLSVFHNDFAKHPIAPSWLRRDRVKHYALGPKTPESFQEWQEM